MNSINPGSRTSFPLTGYAANERYMQRLVSGARVVHRSLALADVADCKAALWDGGDPRGSDPKILRGHVVGDVRGEEFDAPLVW